MLKLCGSIINVRISTILSYSFCRWTSYPSIAMRNISNAFYLSKVHPLPGFTFCDCYSCPYCPHLSGLRSNNSSEINQLYESKIQSHMRHSKCCWLCETLDDSFKKKKIFFSFVEFCILIQRTVSSLEFIDGDNGRRTFKIG